AGDVQSYLDKYPDGRYVGRARTRIASLKPPTPPPAPAPAPQQVAVVPPKPVQPSPGGAQSDLVASIGDRVFFDFNSTGLNPTARRTVERWADWLKQRPNLFVTAEGHTDERGTREDGIVSGEKRAAAVRDALTALGIDQRRISTIS